MFLVKYPTVTALRPTSPFGAVAGVGPHFDPPWREREHHDPAGMIALCLQHHKEADAGTFTEAQLKQLKKLLRAGRSKADLIGNVKQLFSKLVVVTILTARTSSCYGTLQSSGLPDQMKVMIYSISTYVQPVASGCSCYRITSGLPCLICAILKHVQLGTHCRFGVYRGMFRSISCFAISMMTTGYQDSRTCQKIRARF